MLFDPVIYLLYPDSPGYDQLSYLWNVLHVSSLSAVTLTFPLLGSNQTSRTFSLTASSKLPRVQWGSNEGVEGYISVS